MNINKKYIIIFGTLILLLVFITGAITYYNEKESETKIPDITQVVLGFSQDYPTNLDEFSDFISFCKNGVFSEIEVLKNKEIKEVVCILGRETTRFLSHGKTRLVNTYIPSFSSLDSISSFEFDKYIGISVDLKDVVRKYDSSLLEGDKLYLCSISEPSWKDVLYLKIDPEQNLSFPEGDIDCLQFVMDGTASITFSGFIPQAESLNIKQYLVDEQTISDVMNKPSFSEIKDILNDYPVIWQMEKPIIP